MPTVEKVWREVLPQGTGLVAGEDGLYREVSWAVTLQPAPPGFESLKGEEIALVSARTAQLLSAPLPYLVTFLAERGVSAIALLGAVSPEARGRAEALALPLLELPPLSHLPSLEQGILQLIAQERLHLYHQEQELSRLLMDLAIKGKGVSDILEKVRELTGEAVGVLDAGYELRSYLPHPRRPLRSEAALGLLQARKSQALSWLGQRPGSASEPPVAGLVLSAEFSCFISPVIGGRGVESYLFLLGGRSELGERERAVVRRGAVALAIELARLRAVEETEDRLQADLVDTLLRGDFPSPEAVQQRALRLNLDLAAAYAVCAASLAGTPSQANAIKREASLLGKGILSRLREQTLVLLSPVSEPLSTQSLKQLGAELGRELGTRLRAQATIGIGRVYPGLVGIKAAYQEAERALAMGQSLFGPGSITYFGELGVYRLLFAIHASGELESFYQENLGRLTAYDRKRGGQLLPTLEALLRCANLTEAAKALHVHRNTLLYRLRRIQEVSGLDLEDAETRLSLSLALKAGQTLKAP